MTHCLSPHSGTHMGETPSGYRGSEAAARKSRRLFPALDKNGSYRFYLPVLEGINNTPPSTSEGTDCLFSARTEYGEHW
jgi:hypothetical protein